MKFDWIFWENVKEVVVVVFGFAAFISFFTIIGVAVYYSDPPRYINYCKVKYDNPTDIVNCFQLGKSCDLEGVPCY